MIEDARFVTGPTESFSGYVGWAGYRSIRHSCHSTDGVGCVSLPNYRRYDLARIIALALRGRSSPDRAPRRTSAAPLHRSWYLLAGSFHGLECGDRPRLPGRRLWD